MQHITLLLTFYINFFLFFFVIIKYITVALTSIIWDKATTSQVQVFLEAKTDNQTQV